MVLREWIARIQGVISSAHGRSRPVRPDPMGSGRAAPLREVASFFLRLGFTAFGGPAAHVALMEQEAVRRRGWLSHEAFLDLLGACNLIPGPSSTQMAMGIGYQRAGWMGLVLGGVCFILPASAMTLVIAWAYVRYGQLPQGQALLYGLNLPFLKEGDSHGSRRRISVSTPA